MSRIRIKNFGPIKEGLIEDSGWLDLKKVTVFIGNQGSGKSVVAKLIATFTWMEKALTRGDYDKRHFERKGNFVNQRLAYHRLENYFSKDRDTVLEYHGHSYHFHFEKGNLAIEDARNGEYPLPQIMYMPADRNFIANVRTPKALKQITPSLSELVTEMIHAGSSMKTPMPLPVGDDVFIEYNKLNDIFYVKGKDYRIKLSEASSGFQSLAPLFLTSWYLSDSVKKHSENVHQPMSSDERERFRKRFKEINENQSLSDEQRRIAISELGKGFTKTAFINIIEEPEQNLFPSSQRGMLSSLLVFNNINAGNKLVLTTHSPYLVNFLTHAVKASVVLEKINASKKNEGLRSKLDEIVPVNSAVGTEDWVVYELNERDGTIMRLRDYKGLPSDANYLNEKLAEGNELFGKLLDIEDLCQ
jgi:predicted ATPase